MSEPEGDIERETGTPIRAATRLSYEAGVERCAKLCDEVVRNRRDYSVEQRALAKKLAEQMRGGGK